MLRDWSFNIEKISGIRVFIHWTILVLISWVFLMHFRMEYGLREGLRITEFVLLLAASVVLHELGHAVAAGRLKGFTKKISHYPIGGITTFENISLKPGQRIKVALAGPAVNLSIAALLWAYLIDTGQLIGLGALQNIAITKSTFLLYLMYANLALVVFNLIPAFPFDGGRILQSLLSLKTNPVKAISVTVKTGRYLSFIFILSGIFYDFWLVFFGLIILLRTNAESKSEKMKQALADVRVFNVMSEKLPVLHPANTLKNAATLLLNTTQQSFLVIEEGKVVGILEYRDIVDGLNRGKLNQKIEGFMQRKFEWLDNDHDLADSADLLCEKGQSLFPVRKMGKLAGVVSKDTIEKWVQIKPNVLKY